MTTSDFTIEEQNIPLEDSYKLTPIGEGKGVSCFFIAQIKGKQYFMKRLKDEYLTHDLYRSLYIKEYEKGCEINHTHLVKYEKLINTDSECFILMENIVGNTLDVFIDKNPNFFKKRINVNKFLNQLLDALKCMHENHIVYSDLKPQNIMISQINNDVKIIDLGFCFTDSFMNTSGTTSGYSAPEHTESCILDITTDIYGVGKIIEYINNNIDGGLPCIYKKIKDKCLQIEKSKRYQNTDEIIKIINKQRHYIRNIIISIITFIALFITYKAVSYNPKVISMWDRFQIFEPNIKYDIEHNKVYYRITSNGECAAVGANKCVNLYITSAVVINDKKYIVTEIADKSFAHYTHIRSVNIPKSIKKIGASAFHMCKNISLIKIPEGVTEIGVNAFWGCDNLQYLQLPSTLKSIGASAFVRLSIESIVIPEGITTLHLDAIGICKKLKYVELPTSLTTISRGVFYDCSSLEEITIPENVTKIGEYTFLDCDKLTHIYNLAIEPQKIMPIHRNHSQITLHVPAGSVDKYKKSMFWKDMKVVPIIDE